ncbi:MAG: thiamine phosphate synthase, partial [Deltaproteobacteria bacterium]|nr:thiamine phosphate synthase [Deltaproteobacteria bacterium]
WGVHLGQEDLAALDPALVRSTSLKVGISTHSDDEIERALAYGPALLGFGPVFSTATKRLAYQPQGVETLRRTVDRVPVPVVAIGGIDGSNLEAVARTGVALVAMIGYLDTVQTAAGLQALMERLKHPAN